MTTRLNQAHRSTLKELACRVVDVPAEAKAEDAAYQKAAPLVRALVEAEFPPAEMKVLAKYECTRRDRCINVQAETGGVEQFRFRVKDPANDYDGSEGEDDNLDHPVIPSRSGSCRNRIYIASAKTHAAVAAWVKAEDVRRKALKEKLDKYLAFIAAAATYEQVLEIWPEASQVSDSITRNLPMSLNNDMLAEIKADSTRRMKRAA